jgi:uncharacterized protein (DUF58 family)
VNALRSAILRGARASRRIGQAARASRRGDGFAFAELRAYVAGDDPRRIDAAATARSGTLHTRVYLEETALVLAAIVDESPSMRVGRRRALTDAAMEALRAWFGAAENEDVTARIVDERIVRDRRAAPLVSATLPFSLTAALTVAHAALPHGASLLVVTDGFDDAAESVLAAIGHRFDATVLLARDPWSDGLPLRGIVRVADSETRATRRLFIGARAAARYVSASQRRDADLRERYRRAGWRVAELTEDDGRAGLRHAFGLPR